MRKFRNNHFGQSQIFGKRVYFDMDPAMNNDSSDVLQGDPSTGGDGNDEPNEDAETIESLKAKLAAADADRQKLKHSIDKLTKEKGELNKKANSLMSAEQKAQEAQEERERRFAEMEKELRTNKYSKRLVGIGMVESEADSFASTMPEMEDADAFFTTLGNFVQAREKAAAEKAVQDLLSSRPDIHAGNSDPDRDDPAMSLAKSDVERRSRNNGETSTNILKNYL